MKEYFCQYLDWFFDRFWNQLGSSLVGFSGLGAFLNSSDFYTNLGPTWLPTWRPNRLKSVPRGVWQSENCRFEFKIEFLTPTPAPATAIAPALGAPTVTADFPDVSPFVFLVFQLFQIFQIFVGNIHKKSWPFLAVFKNILDVWPQNLNIHIRKINVASTRNSGSPFWAAKSNFHFSPKIPETIKGNLALIMPLYVSGGLINRTRFPNERRFHICRGNRFHIS